MKPLFTYYVQAKTGGIKVAKIPSYKRIYLLYAFIGGLVTFAIAKLLLSL